MEILTLLFYKGLVNIDKKNTKALKINGQGVMVAPFQKRKQVMRIDSTQK